jgi:hypothetical protein
VHEGVEIEGGIEGVGELVEEVDLEGLDANFRVGGVGVEEVGRGGAIVAFEGVLGRGRFLPGGVGFGECYLLLGDTWLTKRAVRFANAHLNAMKPREDGAPTFVR